MSDAFESEIAGLVHRFRTHIKEYKSKTTKEAEIRQQFIDPFWRALGWDVGDTKGVGPTEADVIIEKNVETVDATGLRSRRPDYLFRLGGFPRFVVEAKKPAIDLDTDQAGIFQAKSYAWNSTIPFAILTDFEQFRLFDTTLMPIFQEPMRGLVAEFKIDFDQYETQWDALTATFGRSAVEGGSLEKLLAGLKKVRAGRRIRSVDRTLFDLKGSEPVDKVFLAYLDLHRRHFASALYLRNKSTFPEADTLHGAAKLTEAVQRIMDRLVFMRVIEDREVAPWGTLRDMLDRVRDEGGEFYDALCGAFREYDLKYNGYLFKTHFSEQLAVEASVLADFTRTLYPPENAWNFAAIGDDILGIVYERFLGNVVTVHHGQATIEEKPEVRHSGGVYYTPKFIVDSIIRRVIGPKIEGKTPLELLKIKILDPSSGSGSFLVAALQYLFDFCLNAIAKNPALAKASVPVGSANAGKKGRKKKAEIAFQDKDGNWFLAPDFRAALLTNCIHGVDIDQQAVEVTVMSLYLKMLESKLPANWQTEWVETRLLPALDNNILCGNSLIDDEGYDRFRQISGKTQRTFVEDEAVDTTFRINRFEWTSRTKGFGRLLDERAVEERGSAGFDCIIGNPPYIRVQELNKWAPEECEYYKWKYKSAEKGNYDIYVVFTEKALSLLSPDGLLGFIMPHKWWQAKYGEGLRTIVAEGRHLRSIVDFGDQQVFKGATTYTAIQTFAKSKNANGVEYSKIRILDDGNTQCEDIDQGIETSGAFRVLAHHPTADDGWSFNSPKWDKWCSTIRAAGTSLGEIADVFVGVQTSADDIYHLDVVEWGQTALRVRSRADNGLHAIEKSILQPLVSGQDTRAYFFEKPRQVILYPYQWTSSGKSKLLSADELNAIAPTGWEYLESHHTALRKRESNKFDTDEWYEFGRSQNIGRQKGKKLCVPRLASRLHCAYDEDGSLCMDNVDVNGVRIRTKSPLPNTDHGYWYLMGIINSILAENYIRASLSTHFRGGFASYNRQFIDALPIKIPSTVAEKKLAERIVDSAQKIIVAKVALREGSLSDNEKTRLERTVEANEKRIDADVFTLYGVDGLPND